MKKDQLLQRGTYTSIPLAVLASTDISPAAKAVYAGLLNHLRDEDEWVWPSLETLADACGVNRATVIRCVAQLRTAGLVQTRPYRRSTSYSLFLPRPQAGGEPVAKCDGSQNATGRKMQQNPSQNATGTSRKMRPETLNTTSLNTPQPPAAAGGREVSFPAPEPNDTQGDGGEFDQAVRTLTQRIDAAHREAVNLPMPGNWHRRIRSEAAKGGMESLALIDAASIRAGRKTARDRRQLFGIRHVLQHVCDRAAGQVQAQAGRATVADATSVARQHDDRRRHEHRQRLELARSYWATLDAAQKEPHIRKARSLPGPRGDENALQDLAALQAWAAYEKNEIEVTA